MKIGVMYFDGLTEMVRPPVLQHLIQTGKLRTEQVNMGVSACCVTGGLTAVVV